MAKGANEENSCVLLSTVHTVLSSFLWSVTIALAVQSTVYAIR
jgi:hypothetical protein